MAGRIFTATTSFSVEFEGRPLVVEEGQTVREGHSLLVAYPQLFVELVPHFEHTPPPPEKRPEVVTPPRAAQRPAAPAPRPRPKADDEGGK